MAGVFFQNDGTMGALLAGALTGNDPFAGTVNNAGQWSTIQQTRIAQERWNMEREKMLRENQVAQQAQAAQQAAIQQGAQAGFAHIARNAMPIAPTMAPIGSFAPAAGGDIPSITVAGNMQQPTTNTAIGQDPANPVPFQFSPIDEQEFASMMRNYTMAYGAKLTPVQIRGMVMQDFLRKKGAPVRPDATIGAQADIHGTSVYGAGAQETAAERGYIGDEITTRKLRGESYAVPTGPTAHGPLVQQVFGLPPVTDRQDPKVIIDFKKTVDASDGVKKLRDIAPQIQSAEEILLIPAAQQSPTMQAALVTYAAKIADPTTGVREGEIDKWGGQGYADRIKGLIAQARGGGRLQQPAIDELKKFFALTRQKFGEVAATELADLKRVADASGVPWDIVKPTILSPGGGMPAVQTSAGGAAAAATSAAPAGDPSKPVFTVPGDAAPAQAANAPAAPTSGQGSQAQPYTGINGPRDAAAKVPMGAYFIDAPSGRLMRRQ